MVYAVEVENITKRFGSVVAVKNVSFKVKENEFFSLLGPSGSGKTTTLRVIAGLEKPDEGRVKLRGKDVTNVPTHKRNIGMVFQHLALFPHLNVYENIAFGLRMRKYPEDEIKRKVKEILEMVELPGFENRRINQLSGGQQQRVALARALVYEPDVVLLDEPLGALDLKIRQHMMVELKKLQRKVGITFIYVTHDQSEAMVMSDRIAVINNGEIQQIDTPYNIYMRPANRFVAKFIGEAINFIEGEYRAGGYLDTDLGQLKVPVRDELDGKKVTYAIRPEKFKIGEAADPNFENKLAGIVSLAMFRGSFIEYRVKLTNGQEVIVFEPYLSPAQKIYQAGDQVVISWHRDAGVLLEF